MTPDAIVTGLLAALFSTLAVWLAFRQTVKGLQAQLQNEKSAIRDLESQLHQRQSEAAADRNRLELEHQERTKAIRSSAFEEGRQLGLAEGQRDHVTELTKQQESYAQRIALEREQVARETREKTRAEFEMQAKLYDVTVRPFVKVDMVKGLFKDEELVEAGYQYQLLVNGIPAFQPSVVIEETRRSSKVNEENISALLQVAERAARTAAELYLGAGAAAAKLGPAIVRRLVK